VLVQVAHYFHGGAALWRREKAGAFYGAAVAAKKGSRWAFDAAAMVTRCGDAESCID
jgi:hypothetical protein